MKVLLINGSMSSEADSLQDYLDRFADRRAEKGNEIRKETLAGKTINSCIGCYNCWLKTPGVCCFKDDNTQILKSIVWADQVVWASPLSMGFVTSAVKNANDRMIPLLHPFLRMNGDRMGHYPRYESEFMSILLLEHSPEMNDETFSIIEDMYRRFAHVATTEKDAEVMADETFNL